MKSRITWCLEYEIQLCICHQEWLFHTFICINYHNGRIVRPTQINAEAHTVAVLTLVLPPTLVTMATATMQAIGKEDQW